MASGGGDSPEELDVRSWVSTRDGRVRLWDARTGKLVRTLAGASDHVLCLSFSPDGTILAGGYRTTVLLWDVATGAIRRRLEGHTAPVQQLAFSRDGRQLEVLAFTPHEIPRKVLTDDSELALWGVATGKRLHARPSPAHQAPAAGNGTGRRAALESMAHRPGGKILLKGFLVRQVSQEDNSISAYGAGEALLHINDADTGELLRRPGPIGLRPHHLALSSDSEAFAVAGDGIALGTTTTGRVLYTARDVPGEALALTYSPDDKSIASSHQGGLVCLWDAATARKRWQCRLPRDDHYIAAESPLPLAFSADGRVLAAANGPFVCLLDAATGKEVPALPGHRAPVTQISYAPDGRSLVSAGPGLVCRWDAARGQETGRQALGDAPRRRRIIDVSPDGRFLLSLSDDRESFQLRRVAGGKVVRALPCGDDGFSDGFFTPDGKCLVLTGQTGAKRRVGIYQAATGKELSLLMLPDLADRPALPPDGKLLAWAGRGARVCTTDLAGKAVRRLGGPPAADKVSWDVWSVLAFSADGRRLLSSVRWRASGTLPLSDGEQVCLWDVAAGRKLRPLPVRGPDRGMSWVACAAFSPDGRTVALGQHRLGTITLWEVASGQARRLFVGHQGPVLSVAFAPDGRALATAGEDGTILLWDVVTPDGSDRPRRGGAGRLDSLWDSLAGRDARRADAAVRELLHLGKAGTSFLGGRLRPAEGVPPARIARLVADLGSGHYATRERATRELSRLGERSRPALRAALAGEPALEVRRRIELLLRDLDEVPPALLREARAVEVLERVGTLEAAAVLRRLAGGVPEAWLTQEARTALERLTRHK